MVGDFGYHRDVNDFMLLYYLAIFLVVFCIIIVILLVNLNRTCNYFFKMTAFYVTVFSTAMMSAFVCIPLHFFGDPAKFVFDALFFFSSWTGIKCEIRGKEVLTTEVPFIMVVNHQSSLDTVVLSNFWPRNCTIMMKKSLLFIPFFGFAAFLCHSIFVDRFNHKKALSSLVKCADTIQVKKLSVAVFPEGTRNHEGGMLAFKKGAFNIAVQAGIPIIPCVISSFSAFYDKEKRFFKNRGYVIVEFMNPVPTKKLVFDDVPELAEKIRCQMMKTYERISKEAAERQVILAVEKKND